MEQYSPFVAAELYKKKEAMDDKQAHLQEIEREVCIVVAHFILIMVCLLLQF